MPRTARAIAGLAGLVLSFALIVAPAASAAPTPFVDIHSAGPLSDIYLGNDLSCQVRNGGFSSTEYFPNASGPGDCGTFLFLEPGNATGGLFGPDFANHGGTPPFFPQGEMPFASAGSQSVTGSGTAASPYKVTTTVTLMSPTGNSSVVLRLTEVDSYIVGDDFYRTDVTVTNIGTVATGSMGELYHAGDCFLRGSDTGFGAPEPNQASPDTAACTPNRLGSPASALEEFVPITAGDSWEETTVPTLWGVLTGTSLTDSCAGCSRATDNGEAIGYQVPALAQGQSSPTFSFDTTIVDTVPAGGLSLVGTPGTPLNATVATITDPNLSATASAYSATINWGDGSSSAGTVAGGSGNFTVTGNHAYAGLGAYSVAVTITSLGNVQGSSTVTDLATIAAAPATVVTGAPSVSATGAGFSGSANPNGLPTTAVFQYGLDPKYSGGGPVVYTKSTPAQAIGADFSSHVVSASVSGLVPNALYHVRLVAHNADGATVGPDVTFMTAKGHTPRAPTLGKTVNISPVSGIVLVKINGQFEPLTELEQIPSNIVINALRGSLKLITSSGGGVLAARDAAAHGKKPALKTEAGEFGGAIFKISQATKGTNKGLATLTLVEGAFPHAPTYATCTAKKSADISGPVAQAALSRRVLQALHAEAHGRFRTSGRYSAATGRGADWTVTDRCDGTLTSVQTDSVKVTDSIRHVTIIVRAHHSYLAKAESGERHK